jgi:hypothetical protein
MTIKSFSMCKYELVVGDVAVTCDRPCQGDYCHEHEAKIEEIEDMEREVQRIVNGS